MILVNLLVEDVSGVRTITLNRPESLNAIHYDLLDELDQVLEDSCLDDNVRVVILKGAGRAFCAGDDLKGMGTEKTPLPQHNSLKRAVLGYTRFILSLRGLAKPVLAQVHGYALGAGCDLALACDLIFATEDTKFGLVFAKRGMLGGTVLLPMLVGYHKACELLFSGDMFTANQAKELGIVNFVGSPEQVDAEVQKWAELLSRGPTAAIGMMKRVVNQSIGESLERSVDLQRYVTAAMYHTCDHDEGKKAFLEKREPQFLGR